MAAAARFSRGQASTATSSLTTTASSSSELGARSPLVSTKHTRYQHAPFKMHQTATALGPKNAIEPGHIRYSLQLPRPPIGPAARVTNVGTRNQKAPAGSEVRPWPLPKVTMHHRVSLGQNELSARNHAHRRFSRPSKAPAT
jgi:hypothetical protein